MNSTNTQNAVDFPSWEEMSRREQLATTFWDLYKDVHGFRPRHIAVNELSETELENELDRLGRELELVEAERRAFEQGAARDFEARVGEFINLGAKTRETALRWIHEADGTNGDDEFLCYKNGLAYGYFRKAV